MEIRETLILHSLWVAGNKEGKRANLCEADLRGADLFGADLFGANLRGANLRGANLRGADLTNCKGIISFSGEKHLAVKYLDRIKISCIDRTIAEWKEGYREIGAKERYTDAQIELYGKFINMF